MPLLLSFSHFISDHHGGYYEEACILCIWFGGGMQGIKPNFTYDPVCDLVSCLFFLPFSYSWTLKDPSLVTLVSKLLFQEERVGTPTGYMLHYG